MKHGTRKEYMKGTRRWHGYGGRFPLKRFLFSRLGKLWADVHSELSAEFDRRTYAGNRFWRSLDNWDIAEKCWIGAETGTVYTYHRWGDGIVDGFYVHPFTGILSYQERKREERPEAPITRIAINDCCWVEKIIGIWYYIEYYRVEHEGLTQINENWRRSEPIEIDGEVFYKVYWSEQIYNKHQLSKDELKKNNLTNDTAEQIKEETKALAEKDRLEREVGRRLREAWEEREREREAKIRKARAGTGLPEVADKGIQSTQTLGS